MAEMEDPNLNPDVIQEPSCKTPKHANNQIQTVSVTDEEGILSGSEFQFDVIGSPIAYGVSVKKNFQSEGLSVRFRGVIESPIECEVQLKNDSPQSDSSVTYREGLSARSDEVIGSPIVCGISVRNDPDSAISDIYEEALSAGFEDMMGSPFVSGVSVKNNSQSGLGDASLLKDKWRNQMAGELENLQMESSSCKYDAEGEHEKLRRDYELQQKELTETKNALQGFKTEYALKSKECQDAWNSLRELQNELMRKSMHVGSLAYAIEGQIKEKSEWFSSLRDLTNKFKLLRIDHNKLLAEASEYKKCLLPDVNQMFATVQSTMNEKANLDREHADLKVKFIQGAKERKELYNRVLELKGNIRVFCRCRPLNCEEIGAGASMAIDFESAKYGELTVKANGAPKKVFKFDSVFGPQADQADVFEETIPFATSVLDGYNVCIFAYGQTGTGKTFTMEGTEEVRGVNYRTLEDMFHIIKERKGICRYEVSVSALEVYNEQIRDLLVLDSQPGGTGKRLEIRQVGEGFHQVPGLVEAHVSNMSEVWEVLQTGSKARAVGATNANEHSSRSHCIHCVMVKGQNLINGECTKSKLWLVDLAGSERIAKTDVQGDRLKETQNINRSLSALGDVISALATKSPHIPFRNSKLTHLLQDSLGGDSKTLMFVQISPNENDLSETLCSLNFASRVRGIELGPAKKQIDINELAKCKQMVEKIKQDMKSKDEHIRRMEDTIHGLEMKLKTRDLSSKNLQEKVKELESQLLIERRIARQHVDTKITELQQQQKQRYGEQTTPVVSPLAIQPFGNHKNEENLVRRPLTENNKSSQPSVVPHPTADSFPKFNTQVNMEKENKPENTQQLPLTRKAGRFSMCPTSRPFQEVPASRRNSLIPLPSTAPALHPLQPYQCEPIKDVIEECKGTIPSSEQTPCSRRGQGSGNKKINSILRRSLQKKVQIKSPLQQRRGGAEKVANSSGQRGRMGQKLLPNGNATKGPREVQQKQIHKEKEKGWNL